MNLPNKITLVRMILIPFFLFFYLADFVPYGKLIATGILIIACITDAVDGYIARKYNMVTDLGKLLDPVADKAFSMSAMLLLVADGTLSAPYGVIIAIIFIIRDFLISGLRQIAASKNFVLAADFWGKIKSIILDIALPLLFVLAYLQKDLNYNLTGFVLAYAIVCYSLIGISTLLTIYSGINYLVKNRKVLHEG